MNYLILKDLIEAYPSCALCGETMDSYIRSDDISPPPTKLKYLRNINCKLTDNCFVFKIDYTTQYTELHDQLSVNIGNNFISCTQPGSEVSEIFNTLSLRLEKVCLCDNYYLMSDYLVASSECFIHSLKLEAEIVAINKSLTAVTYHYGQKTLIYSSDNEKSCPVSIPRVEFNPQDKEKQFNRIQTIVNFS